MTKHKIWLSALVVGTLTLLGAGAVALAQSGGQAPPPAASQPAGEAADDEQSPSYQGSISAPADDEGTTESEATSEEGADDESAGEADEAAQLQGLATISAQQAQDAALTVVPGTVVKVELENENGSVVYSVEIDAGGTITEVKIDAGTGAVLAQEAKDGTEADEAGEEAGQESEAGDEADNDNVQDENESGDVDDPQEDVED